MRYAVADIAVPLESVAQICDSGATVTFDKRGGRIDGPNGVILFAREGDTYVRKTWIKRGGKVDDVNHPVKPFARQRQD